MPHTVFYQLDEDENSRTEQLVGNFVLRRKGKNPIFFFMSMKTKTKNMGLRNVVSFPQSKFTCTFYPCTCTFYPCTCVFFTHIRILVQYTGKNVLLTFDSVDCICAPAFVFPNKISDDYYYLRAGVARSEVVFTVVPNQFLHRDDWPSMDSEELRIQKSEYDIARNDERKEELLRKLMED